MISLEANQVVKILVNDNENPGKRKEVEAIFLSEKATTFRVKLSDGNVIVRKKNRDLVK